MPAMQSQSYSESWKLVSYIRSFRSVTPQEAAVQEHIESSAHYAQLRKPADKLCLDCHSPMSPNGPHTATLEEHTHHKDGSSGSLCIACHMPKIETEGVPGSFVRSHTFQFITPAMTDKYKMPNPCTSCHTDKSSDWANKELLSWKTTSPWRVAQ
jgi:formate-dependent nitrite reductase cytochrome c552 subunit